MELDPAAFYGCGVSGFIIRVLDRLRNAVEGALVKRIAMLQGKAWFEQQEPPPGGVVVVQADPTRPVRPVPFGEATMGRFVARAAERNSREMRYYSGRKAIFYEEVGDDE